MTGNALPLGGSMTALATPFKDGAIDQGAFIRLCQRQITRGTTALVVCGSTGEAPSLALDEYVTLIRLAVTTAKGRVPVIAGCNGPATDAAATAASLAAQAGAAALLCAPTPYVKPSQEGIIAHMRTLAHVSDLPLIIYDVPSRVGVPITDDTVKTLFDRGLAVGIKDATADLSRPPRLRVQCGGDFVQLSGDDATAAAYRAAGGDGCISVTANLTPSLCAALHRAWDEGDMAAFANIRDLLAPVHDALFVESNPVPLKAALSIMGLAGAEVRLPLLRATELTRDRLAHVLNRIISREEWTASHPRYALAS